MEATDIPKKLNEMLTSREAFTKSVSLADLREFITSTSAELSNLATTLNLISVPHGKALSALLKTDKTAKGVAIYFQFQALLQGQARTTEEERTFSAVAAAATQYVNILKEIDDKLEVFFTGTTEVSLLNSRLSHIVIVGAIVEAMTLEHFGSYLLPAVAGDLTKSGAVAPYRLKYLTDKTGATAGIINRALNKKMDDFATTIAEMKAKGLDPVLLNTDGRISVSSDDVLKASGTARGFISLNPLKLFQWIGEKWVSRKHTAYQDRKSHQAWLEAHVSLLKLKLEGKTSEDPEYQRLMGIIEKYEDMINELARKNQEYEAGQ